MLNKAQKSKKPKKKTKKQEVKPQAKKVEMITRSAADSELWEKV